MTTPNETIGISRRSLLAAAAAVAGAGALQLSPLLRSGAFAGQSLNLTIIQPHAIAGEVLKKLFQEQAGVTLNFTVIPYDQVHAQATLDVQSGANRFDVHDYWYTSIGALVDDKVVVDVTDLIERDKDKINPGDFIGSIYDAYTLVNGRRYGLPYDGDSHVLFYNTEILKRHGLEAPATWDAYYQAVKTITEKEKGNGIYGTALLGFKVPVIIVSSFANRLAGFGGRFLKDGRPDLLSEEAVAAAEELVRVAPYALPTPSETAFDQALPAFLSGKVAFLEFWTDLGVRAQDPQNSKIVDKWDVSQLPVGGKNKTPTAALDAGFGWAISTGSTKKELAWEFVRWASSSQVGTTLLTTPNSGIDPTRRSNLDNPDYKAFAPRVQRAASAAFGNALPWPNVAQTPKLLDALTEQLALILAGQVKPKAGLEAAQRAWEHLLA
ncbi:MULTISPECIES: extracellular solute-binding protein [Bradyrhizobium]|jgi:multiple sugar transport system substrate-binding protein|uniref:extracellular solute-binding protein n=1 Tax=Bradyrhizobium TaxID=374 RepID=UPI0003A16519|nr:extracellular solute-binding protein [Bradyrhizobium denitrificans]MCL8483781.1 extracellular solute-binding protein [Bradyrhizobium denitrificans]